MAGPGAAGHACPLSALDQLAPAAAPGGVLLGRDPEHHPVLVPLFRPRPVRFVVVGGVWPARVVLLRVLAVGARVIAAPGQPDWVSLGRWATGQDGWVLPPGTPVLPAHPAAPLLVSFDQPPGGQPLPVLGGWQSAVAVAPRVPPAALTGADLVITGRLAAPDAELLVRTYHLPGEANRLLRQLYGNMIAVVEPGRIRYAWPTPSAAETEVLAPPQHRALPG